MKVRDGKYFRPVLHLSKQQIEDYLTRRGLEWRVDSSNESRVYKRNQVRLDLLPLMEQLAGGKPALATRFAQLAQQSEDLKEWIDSEVYFFRFRCIVVSAFILNFISHFLSFVLHVVREIRDKL